MRDKKKKISIAHKASGVLVHPVHRRSLGQRLLHVGRRRDVGETLTQVHHGRVGRQRCERHPIKKTIRRQK